MCKRCQLIKVDVDILKRLSTKVSMKVVDIYLIHLHHGEQLLNIIESLHEIHNFDRTAKPNITKKTQGKISSQPHTSLGLEFVHKQSNGVNDRLCKFINMLLKGNSKRLLYFAFGTTALFRVGRNISKGKIMLLDSFRKFNLR